MRVEDAGRKPPGAQPPPAASPALPGFPTRPGWYPRVVLTGSGDTGPAAEFSAAPTVNMDGVGATGPGATGPSQPSGGETGPGATGPYGVAYGSSREMLREAMTRQYMGNRPRPVFPSEQWGTQATTSPPGAGHTGPSDNHAAQVAAVSGFVMPSGALTSYAELRRFLTDARPTVVLGHGIDMGDGDYTVATVTNDRLPGDLDQDVFALRTLLQRREWEQLTAESIQQLSPPRYHLLCDAAATWEALPRRSRARLRDVYGDGLVRFFDRVRDVVGNGSRRRDAVAEEMERELSRTLSRRVAELATAGQLPPPVAPASPPQQEDWFPDALGLADDTSPF